MSDENKVYADFAAIRDTLPRYIAESEEYRAFCASERISVLKVLDMLMAGIDEILVNSNNVQLVPSLLDIDVGTIDSIYRKMMEIAETGVFATLKFRTQIAFLELCKWLEELDVR